ncbi:E3 ubiquitin-protein ligase CHFR isoform X3 [Syngnathoides biaculeatus]|uniref:E3 ubiquitin-protein ligase CHFR isoform X3 n=1 Tax=Syngnathoides biaculeatus TaxID=300417 RepID=UPI002ADE1656|nr:E3 ubiquitin-protein ligase CHFR isoform X3 [Syngnathoides biaculeatus]
MSTVILAGSAACSLLEHDDTLKFPTEILRQETRHLTDTSNPRFRSKYWEMDRHRRGTPWGKLVKVDSSDAEVLLFNRECTIGRKKGCDLAFPANKLVSGEHCKIVQDENSGQVWLEDMSTNGTVINMATLVKKQTHMLQNGDVIYFVYMKNEPEQNIAYVYHAIETEQGILQGHHDSASSLTSPEMTLSVEPVMLTKAPRDLNQEEPQPSTSTSDLCFQLPFTPGPPSARACLNSAGTQSRDVSEGPEKSPNILEPQCKKRKTETPLSSSTELTPPTLPSTRNLLVPAQAEETKTDKMEESLTCIICQDLLYDCVSLQPCMHTFCAACYSGWMERSSLCPTCRCPVERIRKNHIFNNLVEAYLNQHPEKCRSEEDMKSMDSRNKITQDILQPKVERCFSDEDGSSDYLFELSDNDSDSSDMSLPPLLCRQCPGYRKDVNEMLFGNFATGSNCWVPCLPVPPPMPPSLSHPIKAAADESSVKSIGLEPSTSSDNPSAPQDYCCQPLGCHLICTCCLQPMPDRRAEMNSQQYCVQCQRPFCHIYWGCKRIGCQGCLARFSELNLTDRCLEGVLNNNNYESEILKNYLSSRGKTWRDLLKEAFNDLQQGKYCLSNHHISANPILCICCGLVVFKEMAYKYRQNIPPAELPAAVLARPDCYWGRNCRTQVKAHHAMKFNHICEQTRFKS